MDIVYPRLRKTAFWTWWVGNFIMIPGMQGVIIPGVSVWWHLLNALWTISIVGLLSGLLIFLVFLLSKKMHKKPAKCSSFIITNIIAMACIPVSMLVLSYISKGEIRDYFVLIIMLAGILVPLFSGIGILVIVSLSKFIYKKYDHFLSQPKQAKYYFLIPFSLILLFSVAMIILQIGLVIGGIPYAIIACIIYGVLTYKKVPVALYNDWRISTIRQE